MVVPIGAALEVVHGRGLYHWDIKPDNVLMAADSAVLLSDFNFACAPQFPAEILAAEAGSDSYRLEPVHKSACASFTA